MLVKIELLREKVLTFSFPVNSKVFGLHQSQLSEFLVFYRDKIITEVSKHFQVTHGNESKLKLKNENFPFVLCRNRFRASPRLHRFDFLET